MGKSERRKGADAERELANHIRDTWGYPVRRGQVFNGEPDLVGLPGIHVECKRCETARIWDWIKQAEEAAKKHGGDPAVIYRRSRSGWRVDISLDLFMDMYGCWKLPFTE